MHGEAAGYEDSRDSGGQAPRSRGNWQIRNDEVRVRSRWGYG